MKASSISLWFPSHKYNLGILSKSLRDTISSIADGIEIDIIETYFEDNETFMINCEYDSEENLRYLTKLLHRNFGKSQVKSEVNVGDVLLGRLVNPGSVGFGIFVDIGVRPKQDALLSLIELRNSLTNSKKVATRKIVDLFGFADAFPVECKVNSIDSKNDRIDLSLSDKFSKTQEEWIDLGLQRLIITKYLNYNIESMLNKIGITKYIEEIEHVDPLTTIIVCKKRTRASGLLPILGPKLDSSPVGIFHPNKISLLK